MTPVGFFAYSSMPHAIPETIKAALETINKTQVARITTWEELSNNGKYIVQEICNAIDDADFFCADITTLNANVLFELGFAIARDKRIWLIRDETYADSKKEFEQLRLLTTIGFKAYTNAEHIIKGFFADNPHTTLESTIFRASIEPLLVPSHPPDPLLYLKSRIDIEASVRVSRVVDRLQPKPFVDDPKESSVQPLYWYGQKVLFAPGVVVHFLAPNREGAKLHNARYALISGLSRGFDRKLLMLTEQSDLLAPLDYRDLMSYYTTPSEAGYLTEEWLRQITIDDSAGGEKPSRVLALKLATELRDFHQQLGEYVAENEASSLSQYFVETTAYMDILNGTQTIFVGRKGTGKTANLLQAASETAKDLQSVVCVLKPVGYEMRGLARLFSSYQHADHKGYVIESLWKYLLYSELAIATVRHLEERTPWQLSEPEVQSLLDFLSEEDSVLSGDFTARLERAVSRLEAVVPTDSSDLFKRGISEVLHQNVLSGLRTKLSQVLTKKNKVLLLIDNLDKPWTRSADIQALTQFISGLITAASRVGEELKHGERNKHSTRFNSAIFLRSDIFEKIIGAADEPDKISHTRLSWDDSELLLRVIEERYVSSHGPNSSAADMWHKYFVPCVNNMPTRDYLISRILPRARDIVYFVKAAVSFAVNRKHDRVEERDILDGEMQYSQYAWDSILVENSSSVPLLENVLLEFVGGKTVVNESNVLRCMLVAGINPAEVSFVLEQLISLTFLGVEIGCGKFAYSDERKELQKNRVLAAKFTAQNLYERRYEVNAPFRAYLAIDETLSMMPFQ